MNLQGRTVFITGGSSGIGLGIARACLEKDMNLAFSYRTPAHLEEARAVLGTEALGVRVDVQERVSVERAMSAVAERFGPVHLLVGNAGLGFPGSVLRATPLEWEHSLQVNVMGLVHTLQCFVPAMVSHGEPAHVVAVSSASGLFAAGRAGVYTTTKFALMGMMESLQNELMGSNVGVSICCPGVVQSRIADWRRQSPFEKAGEKADHSVAAVGMDPLEYGRLVLRGVREKALYIFTHPEYRDGLKERSEALLEAYPGTGDVPPARREAAGKVLSSPIYRRELERLKDA
jgi:NAD(P)-dependent dehydrogenase (short-subunit alcohol dehydrogenase family)